MPKFMLTWVLGPLLPIVAAVAVIVGVYITQPELDYDRATVMVSSDYGHGSGVFIAPSLVLTAAHVVALEGVAYTVEDYDGTKVQAKVLWIDVERDMAVLALAGYETRHVAFLSCEAPRVGESVHIVGNPLAGRWMHTWGYVSSLRSIGPDGDWPAGSYYIVDATATFGNSGGPVFSEDGRVIGVLVGGLAGSVGFSQVLPPLMVVLNGPSLCQALDDLDGFDVVANVLLVRA